MAAPSEVVSLAPGRLLRDPDDLSDAPSYGGTELGRISEFRVEITRKVDPITGEEFGSEIVDGVVLGAELRLKVTFEGFDADALEAAFLNSSSGAVTFPEITGEPLLGSSELTLLYVPDVVASFPSLIAYAALPDKITDPIHWSGYRSLAVKAEFVLRRDASNRVYESDSLSGLSL